MGATRSSETSVLTRPSRHSIPKDDVLQSKYYSFHILVCVNNELTS
jgi:hypothetical protein